MKEGGRESVADWLRMDGYIPALFFKDRFCVMRYPFEIANTPKPPRE